MKKRAGRNRTITCTSDELSQLSKMLLTLNGPVDSHDIEGKIINQDIFEVVKYLPKGFVDLLVLDPPYNLSKNYNGHLFKER